MSSRKEEERNEKIIRGLMKLPPNRRCINCDSLGPQYVCTNFWTFICITCSGIHREFTHRVKSVSMAKFTSQEVDALQRGGNQRAREIFLKDWDMQRQRLPNSSNADRIREFIKSVYVDKKYSGGMSSEKPPREPQIHKNIEEDNRRASSYHSYSQSPPYEHQYEDRRYGKKSGIFTRRTGSDRGQSDGKFSSIILSPGRMRDHTYEDRFANEGSAPRFSDYSVSSASDTFKYDIQSPNSQKGSGYTSPPLQPVRDILIEDANVKRDVDRIQYSQGTESSGSFGSSNSTLLKSANSTGLVDVRLGSEQPLMPHQTKASVPSSLPQSSLPTHAAKQDLFGLLSVQSPANNSSQAIDLFADINHPPLSISSSNQKSVPVPFSENEGWATFDMSHSAGSTSETKNASSAAPPVDETPKENLDVFLSTNNSSQWPSQQSSIGNLPVLSMNDQWNVATHEANAFSVSSNSQPWNAFGDSSGILAQTSSGSFSSKAESQIPPNGPLSVDPFVGLKLLEDAGKFPFQGVAVDSGVPGQGITSVGVTAQMIPSTVPPFMGGNYHERKSANPFDLPFESDSESSNAFLDMSSLQAAFPIPDPQFQTPFVSNISQQWFPQDPVPPYISSVPSGGLPYMAGQPPNSQLPNLPSQGHVASLGGNPFA